MPSNSELWRLNSLLFAVKSLAPLIQILDSGFSTLSVATNSLSWFWILDSDPRSPFPPTTPANSWFWILPRLLEFLTKSTQGKSKHLDSEFCTAGRYVGSSHPSRAFWAGSRSSDSEFWILLDLSDVESVPGHHRENHWEYAGSSQGDLILDSGFWRRLHTI